MLQHLQHFGCTMRRCTCEQILSIHHDPSAVLQRRNNAISNYRSYVLSPIPLTAAVNTTSVELLSAVSAESCRILMTKPTATTCIAMSFEMPNRPQLSGINSSEPPATPEAPQADSACDN